MSFTWDTTYIWVPLLALLIVVFLAALLFFKRDWVLSQQLYASPMDSKIEQLAHFPLPDTAQNVRILLVYDTNDESIQKKSFSLRKQLIACGVSIVIDFLLLVLICNTFKCIF